MGFSEDFKKGFVIGNAIASMGNTYVTKVSGGEIDEFYLLKSGDLGKSHLDSVVLSNTITCNNKCEIVSDLRSAQYVSADSIFSASSVLNETMTSNNRYEIISDFRSVQYVSADSVFSAGIFGVKVVVNK